MIVENQYFRASFNDVPFIVTNALDEGGKALSVKLVINGGYTVEDTGRTPNTFTIDALLVNDGFGSWRDKAAALVSQLQAGRGKLIHPQLGELDVFPETWSAEIASDAHLQQAFKIRFVEQYVEPPPALRLRETFLGNLVNTIADIRMQIANSPVYNALALAGQQRILFNQVFSESMLLIQTLGAPAEIVANIVSILDTDFDPLFASVEQLIDLYASIFDFLIPNVSGFAVDDFRGNVVNSNSRSTLGVLNTIILTEWVNAWLKSFVEYPWEDKPTVEEVYRELITLMRNADRTNPALYGACVDLKRYIDNDLAGLYDIQTRNFATPANLFEVAHVTGRDADEIITDNLFRDLSSIRGGVNVRTINS